MIEVRLWSRNQADSSEPRKTPQACFELASAGAKVCSTCKGDVWSREYINPPALRHGRNNNLRLADLFRFVIESPRLGSREPRNKFFKSFVVLFIEGLYN